MEISSFQSYLIILVTF